MVNRLIRLVDFLIHRVVLQNRIVPAFSTFA